MREEFASQLATKEKLNLLGAGQGGFNLLGAGQGGFNLLGARQGGFNPCGGKQGQNTPTVMATAVPAAGSSGTMEEAIPMGELYHKSYKYMQHFYESYEKSYTSQS